MVRGSGDWRMFLRRAVSRSSDPVSHASRSVGEGQVGWEGSESS